MRPPAAFVALALALGPLTGQAQEAAPDQVPQNAFLTAELLGQRVLDVEGKQVGTISDVVLDQDQRIQAIVVDAGGFLGIGTKPVLLETSNMQRNGDDTIRVGLSQEQIRSLPPAE